jgi:hypothetical protein
MIANSEEVSEFFNKISTKTRTIIFTNGNENYVKTLINNLLASYKCRSSNQATIGVFCSDEKAYNCAKDLGMTTCWVKIPSLGIDEAYEAAGAGSELYLRLCFVKIILIKYALQLGYNVLYIDPDMAFNKDCLQELIDIKDQLTFAKYIYHDNYVFVNSNIMRVYPTDLSKNIFDFVVNRDLEYYLSLLPDVGDETFIKHRLISLGNVGSSLNIQQYPAGADSPNVDAKEIKSRKNQGFQKHMLI